MNIAVNTRLLIRNRLEGIGWFTFETLKRITKSHPEHQFFFIFDRQFSPEFVFGDNITPIVAPPKARHPFLFYLWFEWVLPGILKKNKIDVFLSPDGYLSLSSSVTSITVIHDINFLHRPKDLPWLMGKYYNYYFPKFARKADRIATVSQFSKSDICTAYNIDHDKVDVVYNGVNSFYKPLPVKDIEKVRQACSSGEPYFLYVGSLHKRKNITTLLKAFDLFKKHKPSKYKLVIVGEKMFREREIERTFHKLEFKQDIIFTGRLSSQELVSVLGAAFALVFIPHFEGFGLPLLEAMASGIPVITSNVTSLPEIAGDAAILTDPNSEIDVVDKMILLTKSEGVYDFYRKKGLERAELYTWERTADLLWSVIEKAVSEKEV